MLTLYLDYYRYIPEIFIDFDRKKEIVCINLYFDTFNVLVKIPLTSIKNEKFGVNKKILGSEEITFTNPMHIIRYEMI